MNLSNLIFWSITIITGLVGSYNIDDIQMAIRKAQAKLVYESRTSTWCDPRVLSLDHGQKKTDLKGAH